MCIRDRFCTVRHNCSCHTAATIPLALPLLAKSCDLPGGLERAALITPPYLVLLHAGFSLPPTLQPMRCALTAPFHPYPFSRAVYFLCHFPSGHPDRELPGASLSGVRTFLYDHTNKSSMVTAVARPTTTEYQSPPLYVYYRYPSVSWLMR